MEKSPEQRLLEDYIPGCIKHNNIHQFYLMPVAWWILDYKSYDPGIDSHNINFRNGVYVVTEDKIEDYLNSISEDKISVNEMKSIIKNFDKEYFRTTFLINFDTKEYTHSFFDIDLEEYLPHKTWSGKFNPDLFDFILNNII